MKRQNAPSAESDQCSVTEAAAMLGLDTFTVYRLIQQGRIRAELALFGELVIPRGELDRVLGQHPAAS
jgi:excisionase family DNA binding protein